MTVTFLNCRRECELARHDVIQDVAGGWGKCSGSPHRVRRGSSFAPGSAPPSPKAPASRKATDGHGTAGKQGYGGTQSSFAKATAGHSRED